MHLDDSQFIRIKRASLEQEARKKKAEEDRRLKEALKPVDQILDQLTKTSTQETSGPSIATPAIS